jgi:hypothetical protein
MGLATELGGEDADAYVREILATGSWLLGTTLTTRGHGEEQHRGAGLGRAGADGCRAWRRTRGKTAGGGAALACVFTATRGKGDGKRWREKRSGGGREGVGN